MPNLDFDRRNLSATVTLLPVLPDFAALLPGQDNEYPGLRSASDRASLDELHTRANAGDVAVIARFCGV